MPENLPYMILGYIIVGVILGGLLVYLIAKHRSLHSTSEMLRTLEAAGETPKEE